MEVKLGRVLILVVMDDALALNSFFGRCICGDSCLNPCCNG